MMDIREKASRRIWEEDLSQFERTCMKSLTSPEDRQALTDLIADWESLGDPTLMRLAMNQPWSMPLFFTLSASILDRREINELKAALTSHTRLDY